VPPVPCKEIKVYLSKDYYLELPVTLLERMNEVRVAVKMEGLPLSATRAKPPQNRRRNNEKSFNIAFDEDGLLCVRGVSDDDRWNPVLTSNTGRWIHRREQYGLVEVREIEIGALLT
jgi:hypothetical protein